MKRAGTPASAPPKPLKSHESHKKGLGDQMNGFVVEGNFRNLVEAAEFLDRQARKHFPDSVYAVGRVEHDRREAIRLNAQERKGR